MQDARPRQRPWLHPNLRKSSLKSLTHLKEDQAMGRTLYDKIWDEHVVHTEEDGTSILYIDRIWCTR